MTKYHTEFLKITYLTNLLIFYVLIYSNLRPVGCHVVSFKPGAIQIHGLFPISKRFNATSGICSDANPRSLQFAQSMMYAIDELINKNPNLLPNIPLGWTIIDSCRSREVAVSALSTSLLLSGHKNYHNLQCELKPFNNSINLFYVKSKIETTLKHKLSNHSWTIGVVGEEIDDITGVTAAYTGSLGLPQISYFSFDSLLSSRRYFPYFYRTSPPASIQAAIILDILTQFKWNWVSFVFAGDITVDIIMKFIDNLPYEHNICFGYIARIPDEFTEEDLVRVVNKLKNQTTKVIVALGGSTILYPFFKMAEALNLTGRTFVGSYTWLTSSKMYNIRPDIIEGSIGFKFNGISLTKFRSYLQSLDFCDNSTKPWFISVLKDSYPELNNNISSNSHSCKSNQLKSQILNKFYSASYISLFVIDAVLALAHAFHNALDCNSSYCPPLHKIDSNNFRLDKFLDQVEFSGLTSKEFRFGANGSPNITLDIINLQRETKVTKQTIKAVKIGYWNDNDGLVIDESKIIWNGHQFGQEIPISLCTPPCQPGFYMYPDASLPIDQRPCCLKCVKCPKHTVTDKVNQHICKSCSNDTKPNQNGTQCEAIPIVSILWNDPISIIFYTFGSIYLMIVILVWIIMIRNRHTPIVKGSNFTLVNVLLFFISLCLPAGSLYLRPPSKFICNARIILASIMDIGVLSTILSKTNQISVIFQNAINQDSKTAPFRKTSIQILFISIILLIDTGILTCLALIYPITVENRLIDDGILEATCNEESNYSSIFQLSCSGLLGLICVYLAFQARSLPDNFNESRYIYLTSILIMAIEIIGSPASFLTFGIIHDGIVALSRLAFGISPLLCLFLPKIYVIYYLPELNTKAEIMHSITEYTFNNLNNKSRHTQKCTELSTTTTTVC